MNRKHLFHGSTITTVSLVLLLAAFLAACDSEPTTRTETSKQGCCRKFTQHVRLRQASGPAQCVVLEERRLRGLSLTWSVRSVRSVQAAVRKRSLCAFKTGLRAAPPDRMHWTTKSICFEILHMLKLVIFLY